MRAIVQYPRNISQPTVSELLIMRATQQPSRVAYTFISSDGEEQVTYAELEQRARAIGCQLSELVMRGKPVALLYPPGISYITALFGCICAGAIAVPAYPPDPLRRGRSLPCITAILRDATPSVIMTTSATSGLPFLLEYANRHHVRVLATDYAPAGLPQAWEPVSPDPESAALLQYTSGSTATPKGVVLTHRNLMNNSELIYRFFGHSQDSRGMLWLPPYHDMGLVGGIIQPLYGGFPITLMAPADFMQRPTRWLQEISRIRATTSGGPKFSYDLCVQKTTAEERQQLDLISWQVAFNGSEPVRAETMERFTQAFGPAGFRREAFHPCYGLAEATLFVTGGVPWSTRETTSVTLQPSPATSSSASARSHRVVSCGLPASSHRLAIVDPSAHVELPSGQVGEIWISGDSVAQAYWRRADESREIFGARLADGSEGSFLRSGDLGFVLGDRLFVTGRMKDLIIMCGFNHYPQDIELTAELSSSVLRPGCGAAFTVTADDEEQLVVAHEVRPGTSTANVGKVTDAIRAAVAAEHGIAVHTVVLLPPGGIPKTSSGKVQRRQCAAMFEDGQLPVLGRGTVGCTLEAGHAHPSAPADVPLEPPRRYLHSLAASASDSKRADAAARHGVCATDEPGSRWYRWLNGSRVAAEQASSDEAAPHHASRCAGYSNALTPRGSGFVRADPAGLQSGRDDDRRGQQVRWRRPRSILRGVPATSGPGTSRRAAKVPIEYHLKQPRRVASGWARHPGQAPRHYWSGLPRPPGSRRSA